MDTVKIIRTCLGIIWLFSGIGKFIGLNFMSNTLQNFAQTCLIPFYADFILKFIVPNALFVIVIIGFLEIIAGILILHSNIFAKAGLILAILLNIAFLPLSIGTVFINAVFIILEVYLLRKDLSKSILKSIIKI